MVAYPYSWVTFSTARASSLKNGFVMSGTISASIFADFWSSSWRRHSEYSPVPESRSSLSSQCPRGHTLLIKDPGDGCDRYARQSRHIFDRGHDGVSFLSMCNRLHIRYIIYHMSCLSVCQRSKICKLPVQLSSPLYGAEQTCLYSMTRFGMNRWHASWGFISFSILLHPFI